MKRAARNARHPKPKLAHLFLSRADLNQEGLWKTFFANQSGRYSIYVHAKWPNLVQSRWLKKHLISSRCETQWGTVSLIQAELLLLRSALEDSANQFFLLHSESCIPIRRFDFTYQEILKHDKSWVNFHVGSLTRYARVDTEVVDIRHFLKASQFFCLNRKHAELIVERTNIENWKHCMAPDEHFIPTIFSMVGKCDELLNRRVTFVAWPFHGKSPLTFSILSQVDLNMLYATDALFARKFSAESNIANYFPIPFPSKSKAISV